MAVYALDFESGSSQSANAASAGGLSGHNQTAIHFWAKTESITGSHVFITLPVGGAENAYELWFTATGLLRFYLKQDNSNHGQVYTAAGAITTAVWQHIVVGIDLDNSANNVIYIDNVESHTNGYAGSPTTARTVTGSLYVVQYGSNDYFYDGIIDELAIFSVIPSAADVSGWYNNGDGAQISSSYTGLQALWRMDEGSGAVAADSTVNGYDLDLVNTPSWVAGKVPAPAAGAAQGAFRNLLGVGV